MRFTEMWKDARMICFVSAFLWHFRYPEKGNALIWLLACPSVPRWSSYSKWAEGPKKWWMNPLSQYYRMIETSGIYVVGSNIEMCYLDLIIDESLNMNITWVGSVANDGDSAKDVLVKSLIVTVQILMTLSMSSWSNP